MSLTPEDADEAAASATQHGPHTDELRESLAGLAALVTGSLGLQELLREVAAFAAHAIPGADGAGVTLLRIEPASSSIEAVAASHPFVREIDEIQYRTVDEGPCITATRQRRTVCSGSLGGEPLWPRFGPRVGRLGVHSVLSLPLLLPGRVVGAINVYARAKDAFDHRSQRLGELFAAPAAVAVHNAHTLSTALAVAEQLQRVLAERPTIDEAVGLIRSRTGATSDEARQTLRAMSQREQLKVVDVAQRLVDEAVRRARARHAGS